METKLVVLDLDGTLLNDAHEITTETKEYLEELKSKGIKIVIATGRTFTAAKRYHNELKLDTPLISCNGGFIYDPIQEKVIDGHAIRKPTVLKIFQILLKNNTFFQFYSADKIYSTEIKYLLEAWSEENKNLEAEDIINIEIIDDPIKIIETTDESIFKLLAIEEDPETYNKLMDSLKTIDEIELVSSFTGAIDIMEKGITKGMALEFIANYLNIPMEQTLAIGDNNNDATMLKAAKIGIAMENATTLAKDNANELTDTNLNNGVLKALQKHIG
jgi:Cof subfamily protein (haloacid dehalogenase superfamily)